MKKAKYELKCVGCGKFEERDIYVDAPKCFECKAKYRRAYCLKWSRANRLLAKST